MVDWIYRPCYVVLTKPIVTKCPINLKCGEIISWMKDSPNNGTISRQQNAEMVFPPTFRTSSSIAIRKTTQKSC